MSKTFKDDRMKQENAAEEERLAIMSMIGDDACIVMGCWIEYGHDGRHGERLEIELGEVNS